MKNFSFQKDGKTYWYSRAIVCVTAVFCKDKNYNTYVLANQRGTATDKEVGKWICPSGFLTSMRHVHSVLPVKYLKRRVCV